MSLLGTAVGIVSSAANTLTGGATSSTPTPTTQTPAPTTQTPAPTTRTPSPTTRTPTPTTRTPTPTTRTPSPATTAPVATTAAPVSTPTATASVATTTTSSPSVTTTTTNAAADVASTSAPVVADTGSSDATSASATPAPASASATPAPASASATANASTTVIIQDSSNNFDNGSSIAVEDTSDDGGLSTGAIIGIVAGSLVALILIAGLIFWLYRRRKHARTSRAPSFGDSYVPPPMSLPTAQPIALDSLPSSNVMVHNLQNDFDRTMQLDSTANLDSTLRLDSSTVSVAKSTKSKSSPDLWEDDAIVAARIPLDKVIREELISSGGHGEVYRGTYRCETVAIKVLLPDKRKDIKEINIFLSEIKLMASVEHPRIVRFIGVAWDALTDLSAVSEFMKGGDLFSLLRRFDRVEHRPQGFDSDKARIALHVAQALTYLHSLDPIILHRDLKSMNILLSSDWDAKITDFGVSRKWTVDTMTMGVGTRRWMAPEVMLGKHYNTSADIFSFGIVLSELDSHQPPYADALARMTSSGRHVSEGMLMEMVARGRMQVEFSRNAPQALVELGRACVDLDPRSRPTANEVCYQLQRILRSYQQYTL